MANEDGIDHLLEEGNAFLLARDWASAWDRYRQVLLRGDGNAYVCFQAGEALCGLNEYAQALEVYERGLEYEPQRAALHINISRPLLHLGDPDRAAKHLEIAVAHGRALDAMERLAIIAPGVPSYDQERILDVRRHYGELLAAATPPFGERGEFNLRETGSAIRVAYLSAHFQQPAYLGPVWGLINHHDRIQFGIYLLSDAPIKGPLLGYLPHEGDTLTDVSAWTDPEIVRYIRDERIDVLVDLSGYSYPRRLSLFAHRPAPHVVTWFNMYATSGLPGVDAIVADAYVAPPGEEKFYSERVVRLPQSYLSFQGWDERPCPVSPPCVAAGTITFGSLVSFYKVTPPVLDSWAELLRRAPACRLLLGNASLDSAENRTRLMQAFTERGVDVGRLELRGSASHSEFLRYYDAIDVALDAFPYSGGTTTMEAIWQGVPVLTHAGDRWAARTSGSILMDTHLREFCRSNVTDYVNFAVGLAQDTATPSRLAVLRSEMRGALRQSPALDCASLARHMEQLYTEVCDGGASSSMPKS